MAIRVVVIEKKQLWRDALRLTLEETPDLEFVGAAETISDAAALLLNSPVDVLVVSIMSEDSSELPLRSMESVLLRWSGNVLLFTDRVVDPALAVMLGRRGHAYLARSAGPETFVAAIRQLNSRFEADNKGRSAGDSESAQEASPLPAPVRGTLGKRECEVLQFLAGGGRSCDIAQSMNIAVSTVEAHRRNIRRKLGLRSTAAMVRYAIDHGYTRSREEVGE